MALAAGILFSQSGCRSESEQDETPLLAEARPDETNFSSYTAKNPYKEVSTNLLARTVFEATGPAGTKIEVRDLFVPPGKTAEKVSLPGPALLEVLSGDGKMISGEKSQELRIGMTLAVAQGAVFSMESRDIEPLVLRARVFAP
jgi:mannose-6-phosphate isomerase-like protein (cupin superfamily)